MKRSVFALTLLGATCVVGGLYAVQQPIDVLARLRIGLSFANKADMNFTPSSGHIDYYGTPAGTDHVNMGTSGAITVDGTVFSPSANTGTPGSVDINGDATSSVYITCTEDATLAETGAGLTITVDTLQLAMNTGVAFNNGAAYTCDGLAGTALSHTLDGTDTIYMGGRLVGNATITTESYSSANTSDGGVPATVQVIYQ